MHKFAFIFVNAIYATLEKSVQASNANPHRLSSRLRIYELSQMHLFILEYIALQNRLINVSRNNSAGLYVSTLT